MLMLIVLEIFKNHFLKICQRREGPVGQIRLKVLSVLDCSESGVLFISLPPSSIHLKSRSP